MRNVMIYFDNKVRTALLGEIHRLLRPGGYLMWGMQRAWRVSAAASSRSVLRPT